MRTAQYKERQNADIQTLKISSYEGERKQSATSMADETYSHIKVSSSRLAILETAPSWRTIRQKITIYYSFVFVVLDTYF